MSSSSESLKSLINSLKAANAAYAKGKPYLTDDEYHEIWRQVREADPENPHLYHTSQDSNRSNLIIHKSPVLSLNKAFEQKDLKIFFQRFPNDNFIIQPKYDGIALMLYRQADNSISAVLAGDGYSGADVTWILRYISFIPAFEGPSLSCEALIPWSRFNSSMGANPRNVVAGIFNPSRRGISSNISAVELIPHNKEKYSIPLESFSSLDELETILLKSFHEWHNIFPLDGIVLKLDNSSKRLAVGHNGTYPLWAIAWKPPIQTEETRVISIHWNISRFGRVIPQVEYSPVSLCGTVNRFASGYNAKWVLSNRLHNGSSILLGKAGEIIPQILEVYPKDSAKTINFSLPSHCPMCGTTLIWDSESTHLLCQGTSCLPQQVKALSYFYGELKTIGPQTITEILENPSLFKVLSSSPWALLDPEAFGISEKLFFVLGPARYKNYLNSLEEFSLNPAQFMASLNYPQLGIKHSYRLIKIFSKGSYPGNKVSDQVLDSFFKALEDLKRANSELKNFRFSDIPKDSVTYCITGTLFLPRNEIINILSDYNLSFSKSVTKDLDFLIVGDSGEATSKYKKAEKYDIPIKTFENIIEIYNITL